MRYYSSTAGAMTLGADISSVDGTITVSTAVGLPTSFPYTIVLDAGTAAEEIVEVTAASGTTLTVTRGVDGTTGQAHTFGAAVRHMMTARDLREPQQHIAATSDVHGVAGNLVGETQAQTLDNKTFQSGDGVTVPLVAKMQAGQSTDLQQWKDSSGANAWTMDGSAFVSDGAIVRNGAAANFWKRVIDAVCSAADVVGIRVRGFAGQTANLQEWQKPDGTVLAKVDKDGGFTAASLNTTGAASVGSVSSSGAVSGTSGTFSGDVTVASGDTKVGSTASATRRVFRVLTKASSGTNTYESLSYLSDNSTTARHAIVLKENGTEVNRFELQPDGSATVNAKPVGLTSSGVSGKRSHWGVATVNTVGTSGATVTHGAGFTPGTLVVSSASVTWRITADLPTSTTFRVRAFDSTGAAVSLTGVQVHYFCGE